MEHLPLNASRNFELWPSFSPGEWLDFNPTVVTLHAGQRLGFIRRDRIPPVPGEGTVWSVPLDENLRPTGMPAPLIARGEDPRAVVIGERIFLFYVVIEKDDASRILGSRVMFAELSAATLPPRVISSFALPKNPTGNPDLAHLTWEKNWVPFASDEHHVGLIYDHAPWTVILLNIATPGAAPRLVTAFKSSALEWSYGAIRGGASPIHYEGRYSITFFHSSQVVGSRNVYMVGACVFENAAPFEPVAMTREPLLIAPYRSTASRFGWNVLASVVFPMGATQTSDGFKLLCGLDDGEIGTFSILSSELAARLEPMQVRERMSIVSSDSSTTALPGGPIIFTTSPALTSAQLPLVRFLGRLPKSEGTFLDVGAAEGIYLVYLSNQFSKVVAVDDSHSNLLLRNLAVNDIDNFQSGAPLGRVEINPWGLTDVSLIKINSARWPDVDSQAIEMMRACRPIVLMELQGSPQNNQQLYDAMVGLGYTVEHLFPRTPQFVLCTLPSHRESCPWLL